MTTTSQHLSAEATAREQAEKARSFAMSDQEQEELPTESLSLMDRLKDFFNEISFGVLFAPKESETFVAEIDWKEVQRRSVPPGTGMRAAANVVGLALKYGAKRQ